ncbi:MAG TPA: hypothetical protein VGM73_12720, partial [Candidatus Didemnitutus sp.]
MKIKSLLFGLILLVGCGFTYIYWARAKTSGAPKLEAATEKTSAADNSAVEADKPAVVLAVYPRWAGGQGNGVADVRWKTVRDRQKIDPHWQGKMPIDFFGRVEDFDGAPVPRATVSFQWTALSATGTDHLTTTTDATGNFSLQGAVGKFLGV